MIKTIFKRWFFLKSAKKDTRLSVNIALSSCIGLENVPQVRIEMVRKGETVFKFNVTSVGGSVN